MATKTFKIKVKKQIETIAQEERDKGSWVKIDYLFTTIKSYLHDYGDYYFSGNVAGEMIEDWGRIAREYDVSLEDYMLYISTSY